jgi:hypothetical protein
MKGQRRPSTGRRYPLTMICDVDRLPRSTVYATLHHRGHPAGPRKRGPKTPTTDAALLDGIRAVLATCPFHGEGYRKVRGRLAH